MTAAAGSNVVTGSEVDLLPGKKSEYHFQKDKSECAFHVNTKVCTPIDYLKKILKNVGQDARFAESDGAEAALSKLKKHMNCPTEECVIESAESKELISYSDKQTILKNFFKPMGPDKESAWLSNFEIDDVLDQIEKKYPSFLHLYFHMRDFAKNQPGYLNLATLDWPAEMKKGKKQFGVIINTDSSRGNGIHWFAIFGDFSRQPYTIEYFNSSGEQPLSEISAWMREAGARWAAELGVYIPQVIVSDIIYQDDNYSCGTYSLYYIMSRLSGTELSYFTDNKNIINDSLMRQFRRYIYRNL